jgi:hypothetical protein
VVSATPQWISLLLRCKMETADRLMQFVREIEMDFPPHERENIASAFRELPMNAIEHCGGVSRAKIDVGASDGPLASTGIVAYGGQTPFQCGRQRPFNANIWNGVRSATWKVPSHRPPPPCGKR